MFEAKEKLIREQRTIEATRKNLIGPSGKFGIILKSFGEPITRQNIGYLYEQQSDDQYVEYGTTANGERGPEIYRDYLPYIDDDAIALEEGILFDGLSMGYQIGINYWNYETSLTVHYKGYLVYQEVAGVLEAYTPHKEWEKIIDQLYHLASKKLKIRMQKYEEEKKTKIKEYRDKFVTQMKEKWGF